jgi:hypothetical protein
MQNPTCPSTIALSRPLLDRWLDQATESLAGLRAAWQRRNERRRRERELDAVADMNELLLRDMGAPEWIIAQASARRESDRQRVLEAHLGARFEH